MRSLGLLALVLAVSACTSTPQSQQLIDSFGAGQTQLSPARELDQVGFYPQDEYQCGPAALATLMSAAGLAISPESLTDAVYVPERQGSLQVELLAATRAHQLLPVLIEPNLAALLSAVDAGNPVLVMQNLGVDLIPRWHYAVVVGYDLAAAEIVLRSGEMRRRVTPFSVFENTWRRSGYWGFVAMTPGQLPGTVTEQAYTSALVDFVETAEPSQGVRAARAGLTRWPENSLIAVILAEAYSAAGDDTAAVDTYRILLRRQPGYAPGHNNLAMLLLTEGRLEQAEQHARRAVALGGRYASDYEETLNQVLEQRENDKSAR